MHVRTQMTYTFVIELLRDFRARGLLGTRVIENPIVYAVRVP